MADATSVRKHVVVHGMVQGVFFRDTCRRQARRFGVAGWVRNNPDGTVEAVFEGAADAVDAMVAWCKEGPDLARVDRVDVDSEPPAGERDFTVT